MTTNFSSLPIVDISAIKGADLTTNESAQLGDKLYEVFATTGFAYLVNSPLSFDHDELFSIARQFFALPSEQKLRLTRKSFRPEHVNTYRGYFPTQPHLSVDNLKEGFEVGNPKAKPYAQMLGNQQKVILSEPNVWPHVELFPERLRLEQMYDELQTLSIKILRLIAAPLGKQPAFFSSWLENPLSTLRLLHYPVVAQTATQEPGEERYSCSPHTDSGILTLLHQDATGGLEVLNAAGDWISAPYIPGSIVVNIGDLMARVSGSRFKATMHRVRAPAPKYSTAGSQSGRFSVPFFFEPGEDCVLPVDDNEGSVRYGKYVRNKMSTFVEFQEDSGYDTGTTE